MKSTFLLPFLLSLASALATAQTDTTSGSSAKTTLWEFSLAGYWYAFPSEEDLVMAVARANMGTLHLEARYNYEARRTVSAFAGGNFSAGEEFTVDVTPMAGVALGDTKGIIPAVELSLGYRVFDFYAEGEYLFDLNDSEGNFAYTWLELGITPVELLRTGLVAQRTRAFQTPLDLDRGIFAQLKPAIGTVSLYYFNPFSDSWFLTVGFEVAW